MKFFLGKAHFFVLIGAAVLLAGCPKRPNRADGASTMGPRPTDNLNGGGLINADPLVSDVNSGLEQRPGVYEDDEMIKGLFDDVYFDFDKSAIPAAERPKLVKAQEYLTAHPEHRILLEGHCDWRGTTEYNLGLGERRANAARDYLSTLGAAAPRLETSSKGDTDAQENASDAQMAKDRRVVIIVLKK